MKYVRPSCSEYKAAEERPIFIGALASDCTADTNAGPSQITSLENTVLCKPLRPVSDQFGSTDTEDMSQNNQM